MTPTACSCRVCAPPPTGTGSWSPATSGTGSTTSNGRCACCATASRRWCGPRKPRAVDPPGRPGPAARRRALPGPGGAVPPPRRPHTGGPVPDLARAARSGRDRPAVPALRPQLPRSVHGEHRRGGPSGPHEAGVVCPDEFLLHTEPFAGAADWCHARVRATRARLDALDSSLPTVLVNHFPLIKEPTEALPCRELAQWCGTVRTRDWHRRYRAAAVVYGHLHIPCTSWHDRVPFQEVSWATPRVARPRGRHGGHTAHGAPRRSLPVGSAPGPVSRCRRRPVDTPWPARLAGSRSTCGRSGSDAARRC